MAEENPWPQQLTQAELAEWQRCLAQANYNNVLCHCRQCNEEWVASGPETCRHCGSTRVESIACWQFPDG
ncbi:MAG: hypothetical protein AAF808_16985 [Cyanobacteria bacterium P01_D01_bin.2]